METLTTHPTEKAITSSFSISGSVDDWDLPVIKINTKGRILYANRASFDLLSDWLKVSNDYIPEYFVKVNPGILDPEADFSVPLTTKSLSVNFDVIGFQECGYIGLYGYKSVNEVSVQPVMQE